MHRESVLLPFTAFLLLMFAAAATAQAPRELVGKIFVRGANDEEIPEKGIPISLEPTGAATQSNGRGIFRLPLPAFLRPDDVVTLAIDKEGWRIRYPLDGELRVPAEPGRHVVEVELLPAGSKLFWSHDRIEKFIADAIRQSALQAAAKLEAGQGQALDASQVVQEKALDFSRAIRDWAERYGLSAQVARQEIDAWIAEVKTAADADERKLGLAAFAEQQFEKSARHFGSAAAASEAELAEIERAEKALEGKKEKARQATVFNYRDQGLAEINAKRFEAAITAFENALRHVSPERNRPILAALWYGIGLAHLVGVTHRAGPAAHHHLVSSVAAHHKALEAIDSESTPREWATIQCTLGMVFLMQSVLNAQESESSLAEAIVSFRRALAVLSREKDPQDWARAQRHLGDAFELQTVRNPAADKERQEALSAYGRALEIFTRELYPEDWATLQNDVGNLLQGQARRATDVATASELFSRSVSAYRSALEVFTRERHPSQWAETRSNLARAQGELIAQEPLEENIAARRDALAVLVREDDPFSWALSQVHLGIALLQGGQQKHGEEGKLFLEEASRRLSLALEVVTRERFPAVWGMVKVVLGTVLQERGMRMPVETATSLLAEASDSFRSSLEVVDRDQLGVGWAGIQASLGDVLVEQARRAVGEERTRFLDEAVTAYRRALDVLTPEDYPAEWLATRHKLENAVQELATLKDGEGAPAEAGA